MSKMINNEFYNDLHDGWYTESNHPVALLRAENRLRTPWIIKEINAKFSRKIDVLDIGCGAGFLTNALSQEGHNVTGIDFSKASLSIAKKFDKTGKVCYQQANAYSLPFPDESFDAVSALDVLEHVEDPKQLIAEAARVLKPHGLFFFHTFNRNFLSYLMIIKGVEWFVRNTPKNIHVYSLFLKPKELIHYCQNHRLQVVKIVGMIPKMNSWPFWKMLLTRKVSDHFSFDFCRSLMTGYLGFSEKR